MSLYFESPLGLKRKAPLMPSIQEPPCKKRLFISAVQIPTVQKIQQIPIVPFPLKLYSSNFPPCLKNHTDLIDKYVEESHLPVIQKIKVRTRILNIIQNEAWTLSQKQAELGLLYYYLASGKEIPPNDSLIAARSFEIDEEIRALSFEHIIYCPIEKQDLLPSGSVAYLMRAFVRMIFTPNDSFNLGGCYAVKELLNTEIALNISEERRAQIITIMNKLINDKVFLFLFKGPFKLNKDLESLIYIDLKLKPDHKIDDICVRWSLLLALFSVTGQIDGYPNCFAVAFCTNLFKEHPDLVLKILIDVLQSGTIRVSDRDFPVFPLLSCSLYEKDFLSTISSEEAKKLIGFSVAENYIGLKQTLVLNSINPLNEVLNSCFQKYSPLAKTIHLSLKRNSLQNVMEVIFQFISLNSKVLRKRCSKISLANEKLASEKRFLFYEIKTKLKKKIKSESLAFESFFTRIEEHFYLIDFQNWSIGEKNGRIYCDFFPQGLKCTNSLSNYAPFSNQRRLFYLKDKEVFPIDSITSFRNSMIEIFDSLFSKSGNKSGNSYLEEIKSCLLSDMFIKDMAKIIYNFNKKKLQEFDSKAYEESDAFLLLQRGGDPGLLTAEDPYRSRFAQSKSIYSNKVEDFFSQLCSMLDEYQAHKSFILANIVNIHSFNLIPNHFSQFLGKNSKTALDTLVIQPAKRLKNKTLSERQIKTVIGKTVGIEYRDMIYSLLPQKEMGLIELQSNLKKILSPEFHESLDLKLDQLVQEIEANQLKRDCIDILQKNGVVLNTHQVEGIKTYFNQQLNAEYFNNAGGAAYFLKRALLKCGSPSFIPNYVLEGMIAKYYDLPQVIEIGNLNWIGDLSEKLNYSYLVIYYDIFNDCLCFGSRQNLNTTPIESSLAKGILEHTEFFFEKTT